MTDSQRPRSRRTRRSTLSTEPGPRQFDLGTARVARLEIPISVQHEYRQDSADLGPHDPRRSEIELPGVRVLTEDDDLVTHPTPEAGERAGVDVGSGATEQIAVPQEDLQGVGSQFGVVSF